MRTFKTKEELREFIILNMPILVKNKKAKYVNPYKNENAFKIIVDTLTDKLYETI